MYQAVILYLLDINQMHTYKARGRMKCLLKNY